MLCLPISKLNGGRLVFGENSQIIPVISLEILPNFIAHKMALLKVEKKVLLNIFKIDQIRQTQTRKSFLPQFLLNFEVFRYIFVHGLRNNFVNLKWQTKRV